MTHLVTCPKGKEFKSRIVRFLFRPNPAPERDPASRRSLFSGLWRLCYSADLRGQLEELFAQWGEVWRNRRVARLMTVAAVAIATRRASAGAERIVVAKVHSRKKRRGPDSNIPPATTDKTASSPVRRVLCIRCRRVPLLPVIKKSPLCIFGEIFTTLPSPTLHLQGFSEQSAEKSLLKPGFSSLPMTT